MAHEVKLEVFQGPIDLLLHLITRQRVDIYEVSLATITEEYLLALEEVDELDLDASTGFLVVAATLLELKSSRLLPSRSDDAGLSNLLEERDLLLARLVECATYKQAGEWIWAALELGADFHGRSAGLEPQLVEVAPDLLANTNADEITAAAAHLLNRPPSPQLDVSHLEPIRASVRDAIVEIAGVARATPAISFARLCAPCGARIEVVVRFLALLELFKAGAVELSQEDRFGDIRASWTGEVAIDEVLEGSEDYDESATEV